MIGYKAFDENLQCRGFQFEVGKTYETGKQKDELKLCTDTVFHFCRELYKIESVSDYTISKSRVCEVIAEGDIVTDGDKYGTNKLTILREIPREELNEYNNRNSGYRNSGYRNSGNRNSGDWLGIKLTKKSIRNFLICLIGTMRFSRKSQELTLNMK